MALTILNCYLQLILYQLWVVKIIFEIENDDQIMLQLQFLILDYDINPSLGFYFVAAKQIM